MRVAAVKAGLLLGCAIASHGADLRRLQEVDCRGGRTVDLEVKAGRAVVDGVVSFNTRAYYVQGQRWPSVPSAVIKMHAGEQCKVRVKNSLVGEKCPEGHSNTFHCMDTTNLHTHGLHVSPDDDDINTTIPPNGGELTYTYNVPKEHLMGTHWYHAHHHGSTALQADGGMAGILLVEPHASYKLPADLAALYADEEHFPVPPMLLTQIAMNGKSNAGLPDDAFDWLDHEGLIEASGEVNNVPSDVQWLPGAPSKDFYVVNGQYNPTVRVVAGVATLLRMVHGGGRYHLTLFADSPHCTLQLLARDGVFHRTPYLNLSQVTMTTGTRVDIAVFCSDAAAETTINVRSSATKGFQIAANNGYNQESVFQIHVHKRLPHHKQRLLPTSEAPWPHHFTLVSEERLPVQKGGETGVTRVKMAGRGKTYMINGKKFQGWDGETYVERFCLNKIYEFELGEVPGKLPDGGLPDGSLPDGGLPDGGLPDGSLPDGGLPDGGLPDGSLPDGGLPDAGKTPGAGVPKVDALTDLVYHPYHQHVNHFYVQDSRDPSGLILRTGEWRDVVPALGMVARFLPVRFTGDVVVHCHLLQHEDQGMMTLMRLDDCNVPVPCTPFALGEEHRMDCGSTTLQAGEACEVQCADGYVGRSSTLRCPQGNTNADLPPQGRLPVCVPKPKTPAPAACRQANCYGSTCDFYVDTYGYTCSTLERWYRCDCSGCVCKK